MIAEEQNNIEFFRSASRSNIQNLRSKNKEYVLGLKRIGFDDDLESVENITLSEFKELLLNLKKKSVSTEVLRKIKNSCIKPEYIEAVFKTVGAITSFIRILTGKDALRQVEAATCFINLACGPHKCSYRIAKAAGAYFVSFLGGSSHFMQDLSAWAIGNIANDCYECYKLIKAQGSLPALLSVLESPSTNVLQSAVFALNACTKYEDPEVMSLVQSGLHQHIYYVLQLKNVNNSLLVDAAFTLSNCCYLSIKYAWDIFGTETAATILSILTKVMEENCTILVAIPLIRSLAFLSYRNDVCVQISQNAAFCNIIKTINQNDCLPLKKELIWLLSNITVSKRESSPDIYLPLIIDSLGLFLRKQNLDTIQVLHYLICALSKDSSVVPCIKNHEIFSYAEFLLTSQSSNVNEAARQFFDAIQCL